MAEKEMPITYPWDITGEIRYEERVFHVGVRAQSIAEWHVDVYEYVKGQRHWVDSLNMPRRFTPGIHEAFGAGVSRVLDHTKQTAKHAKQETNNG